MAPRPASAPPTADTSVQRRLLPTDRVSLRTLILIRWIAVAGQLATVLIVHYGLSFHLPIAPAVAVIAVSALLNLAATMQARFRLRLDDRDAALYLGYDLIQIAVLLALTGGLLNPFSVMLLAPLTVSASILSRVSTIITTGLTILCATALAFWHYPLPGEVASLPAIYKVGIWIALVSSALFIAAYVWKVADETRRLGDALGASQMALAREQRVSALGALAAAAAHELGSPLGTIAVVAREMEREAPPDSPLAEDIALLRSQSERCRTILAELARRPETGGGDPYELLPLDALVETAARPHRRPDVALDIDLGLGHGPETGTSTDERPPVTRRTPELVHGLGNLLQNALQFARSRVSVVGEWSDRTVTLTIADDGPGFPPGLLARLGEPYLSSRDGGRGRGPDSQHMGLGVFIAVTLLAHGGAQVAFANGPDGGAEVTVTWPRGHFDAAPSD